MTSTTNKIIITTYDHKHNTIFFFLICLLKVKSQVRTGVLSATQITRRNYKANFAERKMRANRAQSFSTTGASAI